jgi:hypothetical protein
LLITLDHARAGQARGGYLREVGGFAIRTGIVTGLAGLGLMLLSAWGWKDEVRMQRTMLLSALVLLGWVNLWRLLDGKEGGMTKVLWMLPLVGLPVYLLAMYAPWRLPRISVAGDPVAEPLTIAEFFVLEQLDLGRWGWVVGTVVLAWAIMWLLDRLSAGSRTQEG